jgi:hypothetical protein
MAKSKRKARPRKKAAKKRPTLTRKARRVTKGPTPSKRPAKKLRRLKRVKPPKLPKLKKPKRLRPIAKPKKLRRLKRVKPPKLPKLKKPKRLRPIAKPKKLQWLKRVKPPKLPKLKKPKRLRPKRRGPPLKKRTRVQLRVEARRLDRQVRQLKAQREKLRRGKPRGVKKDARRRIQDLKRRLERQRRLAVEREARRVREETESKKGNVELTLERYKRRFDELHAKARKKGQTHKVDLRRRRILSDDVEGRRHVKSMDVELDERGVEEVVYWIDRLSAGLGGYRSWLAIVGYVGMGSRLFGSGITFLADDDPDASEFQIGVINTGLWNTREGMVEAARRRLEKEASDKYALIRVTFVEVRNYSYRRKA